MRKLRPRTWLYPKADPNVQVFCILSYSHFQTSFSHFTVEATQIYWGYSFQRLHILRINRARFHTHLSRSPSYRTQSQCLGEAARLVQSAGIPSPIEGWDSKILVRNLLVLWDTITQSWAHKENVTSRSRTRPPAEIVEGQDWSLRSLRGSVSCRRRTTSTRVSARWGAQNVVWGGPSYTLWVQQWERFLCSISYSRGSTSESLNLGKVAILVHTIIDRRQVINDKFIPLEWGTGVTRELGIIVSGRRTQ